MNDDDRKPQSGQEIIDTLKEEALGRIEGAASSAELAQIETEFLGRKGRVTELLRRIKDFPDNERPAFGQMVNALKGDVAAMIAARSEAVQSGERESKFRAESVDVTLPGRMWRLGRRHPLTQTMNEVKSIFIGMGFEVVDGPEVEHYKYNFDALNYPEDHPAMDEQMSFYVNDELLLRTQTTALQGRVMERREPPFRICTVGRCFRMDAVDATHSHTFHQVDCFAVDEGISMADLKGTLAQFVRRMFGEGTQVRFRPDFFPFVEPGAEWAMSCVMCRGAGCSLCKGSGWLELGGAGMIHPNVLEKFGIDSEKYTGFAFGLGIDRIPMLKYAIGDLRLFLENDLRFLEQF